MEKISIYLRKVRYGEIDFPIFSYAYKWILIWWLPELILFRFNNSTQ